MLVTNSDEPYISSIGDRKAAGILSRPLLSIFAEKLPRNTKLLH